MPKSFFFFVLFMTSVATLDVIAWVNAYGWPTTIGTYAIGLGSTLWVQHTLRRSPSC